jgi:hypothetical protein
MIIGDLPKELALQAVVDHCREQPDTWLQPGHVCRRVKAMQRDAYERRSLAQIQADNDRRDERRTVFPGSGIDERRDSEPVALGHLLKRAAQHET